MQKKVLNDVVQMTNKIFKIIDDLSKAQCKNMKWKYQECEVWFSVFPDNEHMLVAVLPLFSNEGLVTIQLEKTYQKIPKTLKEKSVSSL